jgi:hypothetical protein
MRKHILANLAINAFVLLALVFAVNAAFMSPSASKAPADFSQAQLDQWHQESINEQLATLGCTAEKSSKWTMDDEVAIRNFKSAVDVFDTGVVRVVSFDEAWAAAEAKTVYVVGYCL